MKIHGIQIIIWDLDNTLYKRDTQLQKDLREAEISVICNHTTWSRQKARNEFDSIHPSVYQSATETSAFLSHIPVPQAANEMEQYFNRIQYLHTDTKLIDLFKKLHSYEHFILTNSVISQTIKALHKLGIDPHIFTEIVTSEQTGANKPDPAGFQYILQKTKKPPQVHLMVGDRDSVDIEPAKKLGMKTCFVWGESSAADISIPNVYALSDILT